MSSESKRETGFGLAASEDMFQHKGSRVKYVEEKNGVRVETTKSKPSNERVLNLYLGSSLDNLKYTFYCAFLHELRIISINPKVATIEDFVKVYFSPFYFKQVPSLDYRHPKESIAATVKRRADESETDFAQRKKQLLLLMFQERTHHEIVNARSARIILELLFQSYIEFYITNGLLQTTSTIISTDYSLLDLVWGTPKEKTSLFDDGEILCIRYIRVKDYRKLLKTDTLYEELDQTKCFTVTKDLKGKPLQEQMFIRVKVPLSLMVITYMKFLEQPVKFKAFISSKLSTLDMVVVKKEAEGLREDPSVDKEPRDDSCKEEHEEEPCTEESSARPADKEKLTPAQPAAAKKKSSAKVASVKKETL